MRKIVSILLIALGLLFVLRALVPGDTDKEYNLDEFARLPVLHEGRVKPVGTVARNTLLTLRGKQSALLDGEKVSPERWLADFALNQHAASHYKVFRIDHPEVLALMNIQQGAQQYFSYQDLEPFLAEVDRQARLADQHRDHLTGFQDAILKLFQRLVTYQRLSRAFYPPQSLRGAVMMEYGRFEESLVSGAEAFAARSRGESFDQAALNQLSASAGRYRQLGETPLKVVPPGPVADGWESVGESLGASVGTGMIDPVVLAYGRLADAWQMERPEEFNAQLQELQGTLLERVGKDPTKLAFEGFYNTFQPFVVSISVYVLALLVVIASWLIWPKELGRTAYFLTILAFLIHTFGLIARMYIQERPPVTNLYSSAVFAGWGAVGLGLIMEYFYRYGIGNLVAIVCGFLSLVVAQNLATGSDTLDVMRAVLNSNFWLTTHVITIMFGYCGVFFAGFLGLTFVIMGALTNRLDGRVGQAMHRMVYASTAFGLIFSFVGTVTGGIWADQSWGRFWGWDPKENGALLIVIWTALILHALKAKMCGRRGLMLLAIFGNIVTSWAWFGVNMLNVGLHTYGPMGDQQKWLLIFWVSQLFVIALGWALPPQFWRSREVLREPPAPQEAGG